MTQYFVRRGEKVAGPLSGEQLEQFLAAGKVTLSDEVAGSGDGPWHVISSIPGLAGKQLSRQPPQQPVAERTSHEPTPTPPVKRDEQVSIEGPESVVGGSKVRIDGKPSFAHLRIELGPGETIVGEADAMASMAGEMDVTARLNGGFFSGLAKKFLGGESLFVNEYTNNTGRPLHLALAPGTPGDIRQLTFQGESLCLQPGAYIASTPGLKLGVRWAGLASLIGREGLFKLQVSGTGTLWYGAFGALIEKEIDGQYIVDTGHLVAYEPQIKLKVQLAGGLFSSFFGGEGLVTRVEGRGKIIMQTRSLGGLARWLNPFLPS